MLNLANRLNIVADIEDLVNRVLRRDAGWVIRIPRSYNRRGIEIVSMWNRYHVASWAYRIDSTHLIYTVKRRQARWAEYLLCRMGCPPETFFYAGNAKVRQGLMPEAWK